MSVSFSSFVTAGSAFHVELVLWAEEAQVHDFALEVIEPLFPTYWLNHGDPPDWSFCPTFV
jgi:hypothetical protein